MIAAASVFKDGMVIERDKLIRVWGAAPPNSPVSVSMQGKTVESVANAKGEWQIECGPFRASFKEEMRIVCESETLLIRDVAVGEVWLAGGQSNMEFHMRYDADYQAEKASRDDDIRLFDYPEVSYEGQIDEADYSKQYGFWRKCTPDNIERFPAVAYYFAKSLKKKLNIPIGVVGCNWGGTPACAWMSEEAIIEAGGEAWLDDYRIATGSLDIEEYKSDFKRNPANYLTDQLADPMSDILVSGNTSSEILEKVAAAGLENRLNHVMGPFSERRPTGLYNSMLKQIAPYAIKGVIWYQGEADDARAEIYHRMFPSLIRCWRKLWGEQLPFLFVQLAPFGNWLSCQGARYPEVRAAQQWTADNVPNTAMAVISDVGSFWDIHPKKKRPVGERLALLARHYVYGEDVLCEAPTLSEILVENGRLTLLFDNVGDGLRLDADNMNSLEIYQNGYPISYTSCRAEGDSVTVLGENIRRGLPTYARLAWTDYCEVNLVNSEGIPARPGRCFAPRVTTARAFKPS